MSLPSVHSGTFLACVILLCVVLSAPVIATAGAEGGERGSVDHVQDSELLSSAAVGDYPQTDPLNESDEYDRSFAFDELGLRIWHGQVLRVTGLEPNESIEVFTSDNGDPGQFQFDRIANEDGTVFVPTEDLDQDDYVLYRPSTEETSEEFPVSEHLLRSFEIDPATVGQDGATTLAVDSNRVGYSLLLTETDGTLDGSEIASIVDDDAVDEVEKQDDGAVLTILEPDATIPMEFEDVPSGNYTFEGAVTDTAAEGVASVSVEETDEEALSFDYSSSIQQRGDVGTITLEFENTDDAVVRIEDSNSEYRANLSVQPEDGQAVVEWNTYEAGRDNPDATFDARQGNVSVIDETPVTTEMVPRIVEDDYDLTAYTVATNSTELDPGFDEKLLDPEDVATIFLPEPNERAQDATASIAPADSIHPDEDGPDAIREVVTERDYVAREDIAVIQFDAKGVFGYLTDENGTFGAADDGVELEIVGPEGRYVSPARWTPEDEGIDVVTDPEAEEVFLVVDTGAVENDNGQTLQPNTEYDAVFNVTEENDYVDDPDTASTSFTVTQRVLEVTGVFEGQVLTVPNGDATELTVSTPIAPGSEVFIRARSRSPDPFLVDTTVVVDDDGIARGTFNFTEQRPYTSFIITARDLARDQEDQVDAIFVRADANIDRETLENHTVWCCELVAVSGFDNGETVAIQRPSDEALVEEVAADDSGIVTIDPDDLGTGTYELVDETGEKYGPFDVERQEIETFEPLSDTVSQGEDLELQVESDRETFELELFEANGDLQQRTIADAIPAANYIEDLDTMFLDVDEFERTVLLDTTQLPPGTYEMAGVSADADAGATTTFEVTGDGNETETATYIAPAGSVEADDPPETVAANLTQRDTVAMEDVVAVDIPAEIGDDDEIILESWIDDATWDQNDTGIETHVGDGRTIVTVDTRAINEDRTTPSLAPAAAYDLTVDDGESTFRASVRTESRSIALTGPATNGEFQHPTAESEIAAWTNVAPGTEVFVRARARSPDPFLQDTTTTVDEDGIARGALNFSERSVDDEFFTTAIVLPTNDRDRADARFVDDPAGVSRTSLAGVTTDTTTEVPGFKPRNYVTLWRFEDGERTEPVARLLGDDDGIVELYPGVLQSDERYVLVDHSGTEVGPFQPVDSAFGPYVDQNGTVTTEGLSHAIGDWQANDIDTSFLIELVEYWQRDTPIDQ